MKNYWYKGTTKFEVPESSKEEFIQDFFAGIQQTISNKHKEPDARATISSAASNRLRNRILRLINMGYPNPTS